MYELVQLETVPYLNGIRSGPLFYKSYSPIKITFHSLISLLRFSLLSPPPPPPLSLSLSLSHTHTHTHTHTFQTVRILGVVASLPREMGKKVRRIS
ncbi:hypothetical protein Pfo_017710, partial [Paulownia fortunei]